MPRAEAHSGDVTTVQPARSPLDLVLPYLSAALAGVSALLAWAAWRRLGDSLSPEGILALATVGGAPLGLVALLLAGVLLRTGGGWLGGRAGAGEVRATLGWAVVPAASGLLLWGAQLAWLPAASFGSAGGDPAQGLLVWACELAHAALWLWSLARSLVGLAHAHGFGYGRALAAWLVAALLVGAAVALLLGGAALLIALRGG